MTHPEPFAGACAAGELFDFDTVKRRPTHIVITCPTDPTIEPIVIELPKFGKKDTEENAMNDTKQNEETETKPKTIKLVDAFGVEFEIDAAECTGAALLERIGGKKTEPVE
jgi:hypothetical protein